MSAIKVFNPAGDAAGELAVADDTLVLDKGEQAVKDTVVAIRNAGRSGSASTLSKGEVAGSNKKPWKQKGRGGLAPVSVRVPCGAVAAWPSVPSRVISRRKSTARCASWRSTVR